MWRNEGTFGQDIDFWSLEAGASLKDLNPRDGGVAGSPEVVS